MLTILSITGPIFLLIALGYATVSLGLLTKDDTRAMGRLVIHVLLPALLFETLASRPLGDIADMDYLLAYGLGSLVMLMIGHVAFALRGHPRPARSLLALGMAGSNSAFIGYPIVHQFLGPAAATAFALTSVVENLLLLPLTLGLSDSRAGSTGGALQAVAGLLVRLLRSPLILAIIAGSSFSAIGLHLSAPVATAVNMLGHAAAPLALIVIGGALVGLHVRGLLPDVGILLAGKLVLHPIAITAALFLFTPADPLLRTAAIAMSSAPVASSLPILAQRHGQQEIAAAALLATTVCSFVTISLTLWLLGVG